jgi:hypothetical protein
MPEPSMGMKTGAAEEPLIDLTDAERAEVREHAIRAARSCAWLPRKRYSSRPRDIFRASMKRFSRLERELYELRSGEPSEDVKWLYQNLRLIRAEIQNLAGSTKLLGRMPQVRTATEESAPRCVVLARALVEVAKDRFSEALFAFFIESVQEVEPLREAELWGMIPALKLELVRSLAERGQQALAAFRTSGVDAPPFQVVQVIAMLRLIGEIDWQEILESLSVVHRNLCLDPAGVYPRMDFASREAYRQRVETIAAHSDCSECEVARMAVRIAADTVVEASAPEALGARLKHAGYYLMPGGGSEELLHSVGFRTSVGSLVRGIFLKYPDEIYIIGIESITLLTVVALILNLVRHHEGLGLIASALLLVIPATQAAVELMNYLVTAVLNPRLLPKLDFSKRVDPGCATMVAIPTLLLHEKHIRQLVEDLEIRYLANRDPNIFFALLTDLPDTAEPAGEHDPRVDLAIGLIDELNERYGAEPCGGFYLFHRHRIYNPRQSAWMGWERKRGKLLDLNRLLRNDADPFPVKAGDLSRLPRIRYVLTLDSDTELPCGSAKRLIGAMAHPLNRPVIDPELNIVTEGYGILQPRVGVSVRSANQSRLASIYSGETGFDIYSRAGSDVYQDLYAEGIFTGKGIYDVDALRQVLEHRFPRNTLLSHDLIEGAYARAGLVSDVEVIDDYPTHYSAYNRRKHRWLRGDWQIARWIFNRVPDESRRLVPNPISLVSRWKIIDNLRRSLVEPATLLLLIAGWFFLPGDPRFWTLVTLALLFLPVYFRLVFLEARAAWYRNWVSAREAFSDFITSHVSILLNIAFLAHQALVATDAIVRTILRSTVTHSRLLEWETATEAELGIKKRTLVDVYLDWVPLLAIAIGAALVARPRAAPYALPFVVTWCCSTLISKWINRSPHPQDYALSATERTFLREAALRTWRYFAEFSNEKNNLLIPDNVQEEPYRIAERISPTNLGLLLNARQAALEFGYLTLQEFVSLTESSLASALKLPRYFGHFLNWYDTMTLEPIEPRFVSTVDSGNLIASLWSLKQHCLELLHQPIIRANALDGLSDHAPEIAERFSSSRDLSWFSQLLAGPRDLDATANARVEALRQMARDFMPWHLPEFSELGSLTVEAPTPANANEFYRELMANLEAASPERQALAARLREVLPGCRERLNELAGRLRHLAAESHRLPREMDFRPLMNDRRKLLSVGYDAGTRQLSKSAYDLLASESRTAAFLAVAKGDVPQESWFRLGRQHTVCEGHAVLMSWTGSMFEYLMPALWMRSHPDTLLDRAVDSAVRVQQSYAKRRGVPWGISESAYSKTDEAGNYQYGPFGVPGLALNVARAGRLVVSPYSSFLALLVDPASAVANLLRMSRRKWFGEYGFYESADFTGSPGRVFGSRKYELVRCWMAHHEGMSLVALCNVLHDGAFQRWFHAEPLVQANELILQERPLRARPKADLQPRRVLDFAREG